MFRRMPYRHFDQIKMRFYYKQKKRHSSGEMAGRIHYLIPHEERKGKDYEMSPEFYVTDSTTCKHKV